MSASPYFQLTPVRAREILGRVESTVARWRERARSIGMTQAEMEQFAEAFEHEQREVARRVMAAR